MINSGFANSISLVNTGRCGSSALEAVFARIPGMRVIGETGEILFDNNEDLKILLSKLNCELYGETVDYITASSTRYIIENSFDLRESSRFVHKPTGIPRCFKKMLDIGISIHDISNEYWDTFTKIIGTTSLVTSIRDPIDNIISISSFTNETIDHATVYYFAMMYIISQKKDSFCVFDFRDFLGSPQESLRILFLDLGLSYDNSYVQALEIEHAVNGSRDKISRTKDRTYDYQSFQFSSPITLAYLDRAYDLCEQLGVSFPRPRILKGVPALETFADAIVHNRGRIKKLSSGDEFIAILEAQLRLAEVRNVKLVDQVADQRKWIERLENHISDMKSWLDELQAAKDWLHSKYQHCIDEH